MVAVRWRRPGRAAAIAGAALVVTLSLASAVITAEVMARQGRAVVDPIRLRHYSGVPHRPPRPPPAPARAVDEPQPSARLDLRPHQRRRTPRGGTRRAVPPVFADMGPRFSSRTPSRSPCPVMVTPTRRALACSRNARSRSPRH